MHTKYYAICRFREMYYPSTHNFQIWLAFLAFNLFISTSIVRYYISEGEWYVLDAALNTFPYVWQWIIFCTNFVFIFFSLVALVSFFIISFKAIVGIKPQRGELGQKDIGQINREISLKLSKYKRR